MNFLKKHISKIKNLLFVLSSAFIFLALPGLALAQFEWAANRITGAILSLPIVVIGIIVLLSHTFAWIAGALLNWVTGPNFISWSYTQPANNPVIDIGLSITKNFVNLGLVVILVFIAFSIALRLKEYATQKTLVRLIAIALLVNFAPVICGLIVDASNIVMNYFLVGIEQGVGGILTGIDIGSIFYSLTTIITGNIKDQSSALTQGVVMAVLNISIGLAFLLLAAIFIFRYIAIWVLVILSPLAFVAWILPATKKLWDMWWNQLIQWSIIGIPMAFFLYLAMASFGALSTTFLAAMTIPGMEPETAHFLDMVFPYFLVLALIALGFIVGLKTSAMGASSVIGLTKGSGKWVGGKIATRGIKPTLEKARAKEIVGKITGAVEKVPMARWFLPEPVRKYGQMRPAIEKAQERAKPYSSGTLASRMLSKADIQTDAAGDLLTILERTDSQDIFEEAKKLKKFNKGKPPNKVTDQEILENEEFAKILKRPLQIAHSGGILGGRVLRIDPRLAEIAVAAGIKGYTKKDNIRTKQDGVTKAVSEARAQHISNWEPETFRNKHVITAALGQFDRERWLQINRTIKNGQRFSHEGIDSTFSDWIDENKLSREPAKQKENWGKFREHIKKENKGQEGYFKALEDKRVQQTGWREGQWIPEEERWGVKAAPPGPTPGEAVGVSKLISPERAEAEFRKIVKEREMAKPPPPPSGRRPGEEKPSGRRPGEKKPSGRRPGEGPGPSGRRVV